MDQAAQLSAVIGEIYDAALDPTLWPTALESTARFVGGGSCNLSSTDATDNAVNIHVDWGSDPYYVELMATKYHKIYPAAPLAMAFSQPGDVVSIGTLMPYAEMLDSRFYQEWAKPQGMCDVIAAILDKSAKRFATVSVMRFDHHGVADDAARSRMELLAPHFRRAVAIGRILEQRTFTAATLAEALDGLAAGIFIVDGRSVLVRANAAGETMLGEGKVLRLLNGKIGAADPQINGALQDSLVAATNDDVLVGEKGIALPLAEVDDGRWVAHVLPMSRETRQDVNATKRLLAALFVQKVAFDRPPALEAIAKHYSLTPTELRVLLAVAESGSVSEIAPILGIAESTVRSHLHRIFEKTNTDRQSDLIKILASFASPLA